MKYCNNCHYYLLTYCVIITTGKLNICNGCAKIYLRDDYFKSHKFNRILPQAGHNLSFFYISMINHLFANVSLVSHAI